MGGGFIAFGIVIFGRFRLFMRFLIDLAGFLNFLLEIRVGLMTFASKNLSLMAFIHIFKIFSSSLRHFHLSDVNPIGQSRLGHTGTGEAVNRLYLDLTNAVLLHKISNQNFKVRSKRSLNNGGRHSSVVSSAPTILRPGFESQAHHLSFL